MIKIGKFQLIARDLAFKNKINKFEMDILIYGSENSLFTQYEVAKNVPASRPKVIDAMAHLHENGWVRISVERKPGVSRKYVITGKARSLITEFNLMLGNT